MSLKTDGVQLVAEMNLKKVKKRMKHNYSIASSTISLSLAAVQQNAQWASYGPRAVVCPPRC